MLQQCASESEHREGRNYPQDEFRRNGRAAGPQRRRAVDVGILVGNLIQRRFAGDVTRSFSAALLVVIHWCTGPFLSSLTLVNWAREPSATLPADSPPCNGRRQSPCGSLVVGC